MLFRDPRVVKARFVVAETPALQVDATNLVELHAEGGALSLEVYITSKDKIPGHVQYNGYFLDDAQWYLVDLFYSETGLSSIVLSPMTPPSLRRPGLVEYYQRQVDKIPNFSENLN